MKSNARFVLIFFGCAALAIGVPTLITWAALSSRPDAQLQNVEPFPSQRPGFDLVCTRRGEPSMIIEGARYVERGIGGGSAVWTAHTETMEYVYSQSPGELCAAEPVENVP